MSRVWFAVTALLLALSHPAGAHEFKFGEVGVATPWARATIGAGKTGVAFLTIHNRGSSTERLTGASTPVAKRAELHTHKMEKGVMKMRQVEAIDVAPGEAASLEPGGLHIMLIGLKYPLREGSSFPLTLTFEGAGSATIKVDVRSATARSGHAHEGEAKMADGGGHKHESHDHGQSEKMAAGGHKHGGRAHEEMVDVPHGTPAPTVTIAVTADRGSGWNVHVTTTNFRFAPESASQTHEMGEGHAHLYVDGKKIARLYGPWFHIPTLAPGKHEIRVTLNANDHRTYASHGKTIAATATIEARGKPN